MSDDKERDKECGGRGEFAVAVLGLSKSWSLAQKNEELEV